MTTKPFYAAWLVGCLVLSGGIGGSGGAAAQGIFTCVDAHGRKLTADRPIPECRDREQRELNNNGTLRRKVGPEPTEAERAVQQEQQRVAAERKAIQDAAAKEEKNRARALATRYPSLAVLNHERQQALDHIDQLIVSAKKRQAELMQQRKGLDGELEFFKKDPAKAPALLKRQIEENSRNLQAQDRFVIDQEVEKKRVSTRFEQDMVKLRPVWEADAAAGAGKAPTAVKPAPVSTTR